MKVTKKDNYSALRTIAETANRSDLVEFIDHEMELLAKKNATRSTKPTASQVENAEIAELVPKILENGKFYRLSEIKALVPALENSSGTQRIAVICRRLEEAGILSKTVDKRVIYYSLAD